MSTMLELAQARGLRAFVERGREYAESNDPRQLVQLWEDLGATVVAVATDRAYWDVFEPDGRYLACILATSDLTFAYTFTRKAGG